MSLKLKTVLLGDPSLQDGAPPFREVLRSLEDTGVDGIRFVVVGMTGLKPDACIAFCDWLTETRVKAGKKVFAHLQAGVALPEFFLWLRCGMDGRTMRTTAKISLELPPWCRFSSVECGQEMIAVAEQNLDWIEMLELVNEYIPLADYEGKQIGIFELDEFGLLDESFLNLMERKNYGGGKK